MGAETVGQRFLSIIILLISFGPLGCAERVEGERLILASTTSTEDSGLLGVLLPAFRAAHPEYRIVVLAVGTGEALAMGRRGDADLLLVHAPAAESVFVAEGYGIERREVMYNEFMIVGPSTDPVGVGGSELLSALARMAEGGAPFISRGDDSGTHKRELALWERIGARPDGAWYSSAGQGMADVLRIADEKSAYTLTDRGTYLYLRSGLDLIPLVEGDSALLNIYGVIPVRSSPKVEGAKTFMEWLTGPEAQRVIGEYGREEFGEPLFVPSAGVIEGRE